MGDLFLLKNEAHESLFEEVSLVLAEKTIHLKKFGAVGSQQYWGNYARGTLTLLSLVIRFFSYGQKRTKKTD